MKLIEDLGYKPIGKHGQMARRGIYECPVCLIPFECITNNVRCGTTSKCRRCSSLVVCSALGIKRSTKAKDIFIDKCTLIHGDKYDYSCTNYVNKRTNITIICNIHGAFSQRPDSHKNGSGCPNCSSYGFDKTKPAIIYYLSINNGEAYKIGITNRSVQERFNNTDLEKITIVKTWDYLIGAEAYDHEQQILEQYKDYKYTGEPLLSSGNTELFTVDISEVINVDI